MKRKGKSGMGKGMGPPSAMVEQQRQYAEYQKQRETSGLQSFDLYVKGPNSPTWYPAGSLGGDERSKDLIESYMTDWTKGFAKGGIDRGVASSLFPEKAKFVAQCLATYPQLKKAKDSLKFGYKVSYPGLLEKRPEAKEVTELSEDMQDNAFKKTKKGLMIRKSLMMINLGKITMLLAHMQVIMKNHIEKTNKLMIHQTWTMPKRRRMKPL